MNFTEALDVCKYINTHKEEFLPVLKETITLVENIGSAIEPSFKKLFIDKTVEYTTEKFVKLMNNGFTREEAFQLILADKQVYQRSFNNGVKSSKK